MARYRTAVCKLCRREGAKLFLKGIRCTSGKCSFDKRNYSPGQHGQSRRAYSDYNIDCIFTTLEKAVDYVKDIHIKRSNFKGENRDEYLEDLYEEDWGYNIETWVVNDPTECEHINFLHGQELKKIVEEALSND